MYDFTDKTVLITGGTGSFGSRMVERLLAEHAPRAIRIFSRDEYKQSEMAHRLAGDDRMRFLIGDVRSLPRLLLATST
jgi:UDP-N-acetylglucosamine 4,6-dehydratase